MLMDTLAIIVIGFIAYRIYKKRDEKPKKWKVFIVMLVGLFSFSFTLPFSDTFVRIPVLPLGVWILYFIFRNKVEKWVAYRRFAWLGFFANFIFLAAAFISIPIEQALYPENELTTYIGDLEEVGSIKLHPSARNATIKEDVLKENLQTMKRETIESNGWYNDIVNSDVEPKSRIERFPYQLIGTVPKWGSALTSTVYIEKDGKGLLLTTPKKQLYFRSETSFINEWNN
jgi:hypothetical protein